MHAERPAPLATIARGTELYLEGYYKAVAEYESGRTVLNTGFGVPGTLFCWKIRLCGKRGRASPFGDDSPAHKNGRYVHATERGAGTLDRDPARGRAATHRPRRRELRVGGEAAGSGANGGCVGRRKLRHQRRGTKRHRCS